MATLTLGPVGPEDDHSLTLEELVAAARDPSVRVAISPWALERVRARRAEVEATVDRYKAGYGAWRRGEGPRPPMEYGLTTGFGEFKRIPIPPEEVDRLSERILKSHAVGVGSASPNADDLSHYFSPAVVRAVLLLRASTFLRGHSGVRAELVEALVAMVNAGVVPLVPLKGSLGASGDLCPLCHLFNPLVGEGRFYVVDAADPQPARPRLLSARVARGGRSAFAERVGLSPDVLYPRPKEGLALSNGATFSLAVLALAVYDAERLAQTADVAASLTLEAVAGCARAFDARVHTLRGQAGQAETAANIRALVAGSGAVDACGDVQDPYGLRCAPAVHGASRDAIAWARGVVVRELGAATDNPVFFPGDPTPPFDHAFARNWRGAYDGTARLAFSAGNFHGQPLALAGDLLGIALAELASISERRVQMLLDAAHNRNLPGNLAPNGGVNSGYMIAQYTAASLVSENKVLAHPASVDSIPSSANVEDHVSMSSIAARKAADILHHAVAVLTIELMCGAQAVEWRIPGTDEALADGSTRPALRRAWPAGPQDRAVRRSPDAAARLDARAFRAGLRPERVRARVEALGAGTRHAYRSVRARVAPLVEDRVLADDLNRLLPAVRDGVLLAEVEAGLGAALTPVGG